MNVDEEKQLPPWYPFQWEQQNVAQSPRTGVRTVHYHFFATLQNQFFALDDTGTVDVTAFSNALEELIREVVGVLGPTDGDRMGVRITGTTNEGQEVSVAVPFRPFADLTALQILGAIENVLNSSNSLEADLTIAFSVLERAGDAPLRLRGRKAKFQGDVNAFIHNSKSVVQIHPENDDSTEDCFWQFLALGISDLVRRKVVEPLTDVSITEVTWDRLMKGNERFQRRQVLAKELMHVTQIHLPQIEAVNHVSDIKLIENLFEIRIVLFDIVKQNALAYPDSSVLPYASAAPTLFGAIQRNEGALFDHVHYVSKPASFATTKNHGPFRMCMLCFEPYNRNKFCRVEECGANTLEDRCTVCHVCDSACRTCRTVECGKSKPMEGAEYTPYAESVKCDECHRRFYSQRCEILHEKNCMKIGKAKCEICERNIHPGLQCDEWKCYLCGVKRKRGQEHECFVKPDTLAKPAYNYWVYDFETCLDEERNHVLYLCTATVVYPEFYDKELEELERKYPSVKVKNRPVFVFWGLGDPKQETGVYEFFKFLMEDALKETTFFAHNAGKYDAIFIEHHMTQYRNLQVNKLSRGLKILCLSFPERDLVFKDTLNFIPTSLRNMSSDFGIQELKKGFFPHSIMTKQYLENAETTQFIVPRPDASVFREDFHISAKSSDEKELADFQQAWRNNPDPWDLKEDSIKYCISDTVLLAETIQVFKEKTEALTKDIVRQDYVKEPILLDPFRYLTLPSAVMKFYMSQLLPKNTIGIIDRYQFLQEIGAHEWMAYLERTKGWNIYRTSHFEGLPVSGVLETTEGKTILLRYLDCYHHGCYKCFQGISSRNYRRNLTLKQCRYELKIEEEKWLQENVWESNPPRDLEIMHYWSHEWEEKKEETEVKKWYQEYIFDGDPNAPLDPREAYKGGHTEMYKMRHKGDVSMVDFVSQYPTSLMGTSFSPYTGDKLIWNMPVGTPQIEKFPPTFDFATDKCGVIKCTVLPPQNLYAPFLGCKVPSEIQVGGYEMLYGLCKACMFERREDDCTHSEEEREILGTWTLVEIQYALQLGYKVTDITEVWVYPDTSHSLFSDFIIPFMIKKMCCKTSGLVENGAFTQKGRDVCQYVKEISDRDLNVEDFIDSPAERNIAKLMMNSFYGKWGQRSVWDESQAFNESKLEDCRKLLLNNKVIIKFAEVLDTPHGQVVVVDFENRVALTRGDTQKNDHIAAHVTAYGRIMLNQVLQTVGRKAVYTDTDSVFHTRMDPLPYQTGFRTGDLELELPRGMNWSACGRKFYAYEKPNGAVVCKQKGVTLRKSMVPLFTPDALDRLIRGTFQKLYEVEGESMEESMVALKKLKKDDGDAVPTIVVNQRLFKTQRENHLCARKQTVDVQKKTMFLVWALKRKAVFLDNGDIDTVPYGFIE